MPKYKITINAPTMMLFAMLCGVSYILNIYTNGFTTEKLFSIYRSTELMDPCMYLRFFLHVCGYTDLSVLLEDLFLILAIGPMIEDRHQQRVAILILAIAFVSSVAHFFFFPGISLMGAKGVITGLLVLGSFTGDKDGSIPVTFLIMLVVLIGQQVYKGYYAQTDTTTLAYVTESIIGGVIGAGFTYMK